MKKFTLLLCVFVVSVMMPQVVLADEPTYPSVSYNSETHELVITTNEAGTLTSALVGNFTAADTIVFVGKFNSADLNLVSNSAGFSSVKKVDMTNALFLKESTYFYLTNDEQTKPSSNVKEGDKCIVGGTLYKLTANKRWNFTGNEPTNGISYTTYDKISSMNSQANSANFNYAQVNVKHYYKVEQQREWVDVGQTAPSGEYLGIENSYSDLPNAADKNENAYYGVVLTRNYYRLFYGNKWVQISAPENTENIGEVPNNWGDINNWSVEGYNVGDKLKRQTGESYDYFEVQDIDQNKKRWEYINNTGEGVVNPVEATDLTLDQISNNTNWGNYEKGSYISKIASCQYYQSQKVKVWGGPYETGNNNATTPNDITEDNIANNPKYNIGGYNVDAYIVYDLGTQYFELVVDGSPQWESYGGTPDKVDFYFADNDDRDNHTASAPLNSIAVVGATNKYVYDNSSWIVWDGTEVYDYSGMKFTYWASTLKTVVLPPSVTATQLPDDVLMKNADLKCSAVTKVVYGKTYATIDNNKQKPVDAYGSEGNVSKLIAILCKNSFFDANNITSHYEVVAGYDDMNKMYTASAGALDVDYINNSPNLSNGVKVLDLSLATVTKANLSALNRDDIEYIILPGKKTKDFVCDSTNYYSGSPKTLNMTNLHAVISAQADTLVAHIVVPGSLARARYYATGGTQAGESFALTVKSLKSVTLSGSLNNEDISTRDANKGLSGEMQTITKIDLEKAYFPDYRDMSFLNAGFQDNKGGNSCKLKYISLPTTPLMTQIPSDCFRNLWSLDSLCIPFNYEIIHDGALYDSNVEHLTTTDSIGGALIDNGPLTYTLSANLKQLGDAPAHKLNAQGVPEGTAIEVFPKENGVKEIYSLATKVPICYKNVFSYALTFGYGGQDQSKVYCRDRYFNNGESEKSFVVLRYPSKEVFARRRAKGKPVELQDYTGTDAVDKGYALMEKKYTDITKVYTKKDQTGAVDANGNPLLWPARTEGNRAYNQASVGAIWNDWGKTYSGENNSEINDGEAGVSNSSRSTVRRFEGEGVYTSPIDLSAGTSAVGVLTDAYTFTPKANWQNMFQYKKMPTTYDGVKYDKIIVKFKEAVPENFYIHSYGANNMDNSPALSGLTEYEVTLSDTIPDFTIFNMKDGFDWTNNTASITIDSVYFLKTDGNKKLYISVTNGKSDNVDSVKAGGSKYTFRPIGNVKNMFQYLNMPIPTDHQYKKIVVKFAYPVPAGFNIHAFGERNEFYSLKDSTKFEIPLQNGKTQIEDFTIFNWDDAYWTKDLLSTARPDTIRKIEITECYFTTEDYVWPEVTSSKYKHDVANGEDFNLVDYIGWHQIILTQAAYYEPVEKVKTDTIIRNYVDDGWFTFCIPFDMTYSQVVKMMGVPKSAGNVKNFVGGVKQDTDVMPDIRQLNSVVRTKGANANDNNSVVFRLTTNLAVQDKKTAKYLDFAQSGENMTTMSTKYASNKSTDAPETPGANVDPVCLIGGRPYIIKAYKRVGETIAERNLGKYILTHYSDEFSESASCANDGADYYEQLYTYKETTTGGEGAKSKVVEKDKDNLITMRFAKPYEGHKVQAYDGSEKTGGQLVFDTLTIDGAHATQRFYYTMVGQFWEQDLPQYCVYLSQGQAWKRYAKTDLNFKWDPYKCVIMCTPEIVDRDYVTTDNIENSLKPDEATQAKITAELEENKQTIFDKPQNYATDFNRFGGGFRDISKCYFPMNLVGTKDWIPAPMTLWFFGRNDYYFGNQSVPQANPTRYILTIDNEDEIIEYGEEVTNVKAIDTLDGVPQLTGKSRVYNLSGQYMGNTTDGLSRGVYIVDGRKIVLE